MRGGAAFISTLAFHWREMCNELVCLFQKDGDIWRATEGEERRRCWERRREKKWFEKQQGVRVGWYLFL